MNSLVCPISSEQINSNVSRLTVFLNVILMGIFLYTLEPFVIAFVALDYFIRAFVNIRYSPVRVAAIGIEKILGLEKKLIDLAPKIFASRLGFLCAATATVLIFLGYSVAAMVVTAILMVLSIMDSVFNFCVGCWLYSYVVLPFYKKR